MTRKAGNLESLGNSLTGLVNTCLTGKVLRRHQGKRHILQKKSSKRKRHLGKVALVASTDVWAVKQNLPFA